MRPFFKGVSILLVWALAVVASVGYAEDVKQAPIANMRDGKPLTLLEARQGFATHLVLRHQGKKPVLTPPAGFEIVHYPDPIGALPAYVATAGEGRHPAIVWVSDGFDNSIDDTPWASPQPDYDPSASAFRKAGIVTMYPSRRGGNAGDPGYVECLYGEVDDVIAAGKYLATRSDVDPQRVYLGGHGMGGTLALLVAEATNQFRAVFAFGPGIGSDWTRSDNPFDASDRREIELRSALPFLGAIRSPTIVMEGMMDPSSGDQLHMLARSCANPLVQFYQSSGLTHFSELAAITPAVARTINADAGSIATLDFSKYDSMLPLRPDSLRSR